MNQQRYVKFLTAGAIILAGIFVGCSSGNVAEAQSTSAAGVSGPPVMSAFWGARMPRVCAAVTSPPNAAQATALIQCYMDHATRENLFLMQNVKIQMTDSRPGIQVNLHADNFDVSANVYFLHGSNDYYNCAPINEAVMHNTGRNCFVTHGAGTDGECWRVHDGTYHCELPYLVGPEGRANTLANQPGPTTF